MGLGGGGGAGPGLTQVFRCLHWGSPPPPPPSLHKLSGHRSGLLPGLTLSVCPDASVHFPVPSALPAHRTAPGAQLPRVSFLRVQCANLPPPGFLQAQPRSAAGKIPYSRTEFWVFRGPARGSQGCLVLTTSGESAALGHCMCTQDSHAAGLRPAFPAVRPCIPPASLQGPWAALSSAPAYPEVPGIALEAPKSQSGCFSSWDSRRQKS